MSAAESASTLRQAFVEAFARPDASGPAAETSKFVAIREGGSALAVPLGEIRELHRAGRLTRVPGVPGLAGLATLRGALVPVYRLGRFLGQEEGIGHPAWLLVARAEAPVALAFDRFEAYLETPAEAIQEGPGTRPLRILRQGEASRGIVDIPSILADIRELANGANTDPRHGENR